MCFAFKLTAGWSLFAIVTLERDDKDGDNLIYNLIDESRVFVNSSAPIPLEVTFQLLDLSSAGRGVLTQFLEGLTIFSNTFFCPDKRHCSKWRSTSGVSTNR